MVKWNETDLHTWTGYCSQLSTHLHTGHQRLVITQAGTTKPPSILRLCVRPFQTQRIYLHKESSKYWWWISWNDYSSASTFFLLCALGLERCILKYLLMNSFNMLRHDPKCLISKAKVPSDRPWLLGLFLREFNGSQWSLSGLFSSVI